MEIKDLMDQGNNILVRMENLLEEQGRDIDTFFNEGLTSVTTTEEGKVVRNQFDNLKKQAQFAFGKNFFTSRELEFGHVDIPIVGVRLSALADALQKYEDALRKARGAGRERIQEQLEAEEVAAPGTAIENKKPLVFVKNIAGVKLIKKDIQKMLLGVAAVERLPVQNELAKKERYFALVDKLNGQEFKDQQHQLNIIKTKGLNILTGKVNVRIEAENKSLNSYKGWFQNAFGRNASSILRKGKFEKDFKRFFLDEFDTGELTGSPSINDKIVKDIGKIAQGKKPTPVNTRKRISKKVKNAVPKNLSKTIAAAKQSKKKLSSQAKKTVAAAKVSSSNRVRNTKRATGREQLNLAKVQAAINTRLPAEVRRNMGRPALINQTGRFSNSVRVTGLRQAPNSVVADYTYQLNPYETFENNGVRQWPTGYNPKPLISKSIRNLAAAFIDQKFTLRRV
tara:strand:- start:508 stop:1866 length:1359 start_codon:yes stop_codon:yes gene_type:complete